MGPVPDWDAMKHPSSRMLHAYWDDLRGARAAPERGEIEPGAIRHVLADSLMLEIEPPRRAATVRLAGTRICALFGRELRGADFRRLWGAGAGGDPWRLVEIVAEETAGVVVGLEGRTQAGDAVDLELVLLPLRHRGRTQDRVIGALSPGASPVWLGLRPLVSLETRTLRVLTAQALPPEPANDPVPMRRMGLVVHQGGRL